MHLIATLVAVMIAIGMLVIDIANAQQQAKPQPTALTKIQQQQLQVWSRYRGWSMTARAFNIFDHCMQKTGKWTYRC